MTKREAKILALEALVRCNIDDIEDIIEAFILDRDRDSATVENYIKIITELEIIFDSLQNRLNKLKNKHYENK